LWIEDLRERVHTPEGRAFSTGIYNFGVDTKNGIVNTAKGLYNDPLGTVWGGIESTALGLGELHYRLNNPAGIIQTQIEANLWWNNTSYLDKWEAAGYGTGAVGFSILTRRLPAPSALFKYIPRNYRLGSSFTFSIMSPTNATGMSGYRLLGIKYGKFTGALDYHNWPTRSASHLAKGFSPISDKFYHYHWGSGNAAKRHMLLGINAELLDASQLRTGWFGRKY
jgi:hypothetical protein